MGLIGFPDGTTQVCETLNTIESPGDLKERGQRAEAHATAFWAGGMLVCTHQHLLGHPMHRAALTCCKHQAKQSVGLTLYPYRMEFMIFFLQLHKFELGATYQVGANERTYFRPCQN